MELTPDHDRATGVTFVNSAGEEFFQPAEMVILSAYILQNVRLLLLSGIGKPTIPIPAKVWWVRTTPTRPCPR